MQFSSNIKDLLSTIAGVAGAVAFVGGTIVASLTQSGIVVPIFITIIVGVCGAISVALIGLLNGKNPDGKTKTLTQVTESNKLAKETKEVKK
jgi:ABC-type transport system involved in multi-copper enzyme maturation permease subunit